MKRLLCLLCLLPLALLATGCNTLEAIKHPFIRTTNAVPFVVTTPGATNILSREIPASTNVTAQADGSIVTTITPSYVTNFVTITPSSSFTNYATNVTVAVAPSLESAISTLQTVNSFNPTPSGPIINLVLAGLTGGLAWFGRLKTRQLAQAQSEARDNGTLADTHYGFARTMALAIEEMKSTETKQMVTKLSEAAGHAPQLHDFVQGLTDRFKPKAA